MAGRGSDVIAPRRIGLMYSPQEFGEIGRQGRAHTTGPRGNQPTNPTRGHIVERGGRQLEVPALKKWSQERTLSWVFPVVAVRSSRKGQKSLSPATLTVTEVSQNIGATSPALISAVYCTG